MSAIPGSVPVAGLMAPTDSGDDYAVTDAVYGRDGLRSVADNAARNAITEDRRREGMLVFTQDAKKYWKLLASPWLGTDSDWTEFKVGLPEFKNAAIPNAPTVIDEVPVLSYRGAFWYLTFYKGSSTYSFIVSTANDGATAVNFNRTAQSLIPDNGAFDLGINVVVNAGSMQLIVTPASTGWGVVGQRMATSL